MSPSTLLEHPEQLSRIDKGYLVAWGRREVLRVASGGILLVGLLVALALVHSAYWLLLLLVVVPVALFLVLFFRNPRRRIPGGPGLLVSPADGTVADITEVEEVDFIGAPAIRIGIFLSVFNVHVNRAPARGRVEWVCHRKGAYHDARSEAAARENEANLIGFVYDDRGGPEGLRILVRQISGAIARRIVCPLTSGESVERGGLIGMIKYGSRTELYIPVSAGVDVGVEVGHKVKGGTTVLASWPVAGLGE